MPPDFFVTHVPGRSVRFLTVTSSIGARWRWVYSVRSCQIWMYSVFGMAFSTAIFWGHRGITHSLFFALLLSAVLVCAFYFRKPTAAIVGVFLYLFVCTASHGVLDAMTNGGLGVAFFSPFNTERYFFGFRPIVVSPISVHQFFNERGLQVLASEAKWVWLPSFLLLVIGRAFKGNRSGARWPNRVVAGVAELREEMTTVEGLGRL